MVESSSSSSSSKLTLALLCKSIFFVLILLAGATFVPWSRSDLESGAHELSSRVHKILRSAEALSYEGRRKQWIERISWEPRAFLVRNFLATAECEHLVGLAKPHMRKSMAFDLTQRKEVDNPVFTGTHAFVNRGHDKVVSDIEERISDLTFLPSDHGESMEVFHYEVGQKQFARYDPSFYDFRYYHPNWRVEVNAGTPIHGPRLSIATVHMYLSDAEEGGEMVFPRSGGRLSSSAWANCGKEGLSIKLKKGDALVLWNLKPDGSFDKSSYHGDCPLVKGDKWLATKRIHVGKYNISGPGPQATFEWRD